MSTEQNKAIARRSIEELWNDRNVAVIDELFAEDYHDPAVMTGLPRMERGSKRHVRRGPARLCTSPSRIKSPKETKW